MRFNLDQNCICTSNGAKGLCQSTTRPYMLVDASPKTCSNIKVRIFNELNSKHQKLEYSPNQSKSKSNERVKMLEIYTLQSMIVID